MKSKDRKLIRYNSIQVWRGHSMGVIIKYSRFFNVTIREDGSDNTLEGFTFFPTRKSRHKLSNYNLVFRPRPSGFEVFYSETPLIPISDKIRFSFGFSIADTGLFEKYGLTRQDESDTTVYQPGLYFDNLNPDGSIITDSPASIVASGTGPDETVAAADTYKIYRQTFKVYDAAAGTPPSSYELSHEYATSLVQTNPVAPGAGDYLITTINSIDLEEDYISDPGPYLLEADTDPPPDRKVYLSEELGRKGAHGVIDIYWENSQDTISDPDKGQEYNITFKPK